MACVRGTAKQAAPFEKNSYVQILDTFTIIFRRVFFILSLLY